MTTADYRRGERFIFEDGEILATRSRIHSRLILKDTGCSLSRFTTSGELLRAFKDAMDGVYLRVAGQTKTHYESGALNLYNKGVLHRDISIGNILLNASPTDGNAGILIDLDHAVVVEEYKPLIEDTRTVSGSIVYGHEYLNDLTSCQGSPMFMSCEILSRKRVNGNYSAPLVDGSAGVVRPKLPWEDEDEDEDEDTQNTTTVQPPPKLSPFYHSLSHDLESFFWVFMWLVWCFCFESSVTFEAKAQHSAYIGRDLHRLATSKRIAWTSQSLASTFIRSTER